MSLKLDLLLTEIDGKILTGDSDLQEIKVTGGYASDLLSDVMGNSREGDAWITIMRHLNVIAVASMVGLPVIIFARNTEPEKTIVEKAEAEGICLISSPLNSFEICGKLYILLNQK